MQAWWCVSDRSSSVPMRAETFGRCKTYASRCQILINQLLFLSLSLHLCMFEPFLSICLLLIQAVALFFNMLFSSPSYGTKFEPGIFVFTIWDVKQFARCNQSLTFFLQFTIVFENEFNCGYKMVITIQ